MGSAVDLKYMAFLQIEADGELMLEEDFIMNVFSPWNSKLTQFELYLT